MEVNQSYQTLTVRWNYLGLFVTICMTRLGFIGNCKESFITLLEYKGYQAGTRKNRSRASKKLNLAETLWEDTSDS